MTTKAKAAARTALRTALGHTASTHALTVAIAAHTHTCQPGRTVRDCYDVLRCADCYMPTIIEN